MIRSSPDVTMVIMETVGSRVGATERLSILNPRPLNKPATRDKEPALFSSVTEMMCSIPSVYNHAVRMVSLLSSVPGFPDAMRFCNSGGSSKIIS